jgi:hypothetical protein
MLIANADLSTLVLQVKGKLMEVLALNKKLLNYIIIVLIVARVKNGIMMFLEK